MRSSRRQVVPGDRLRLEIVLDGGGRARARTHASHLGGQVVAGATSCWG
jgi:hypothetical protein